MTDENPYDDLDYEKELLTHGTFALNHRRQGWNEGYEKGQQNPDPKQYAKREELDKKIEELIVERNVSHILVSGNDVNRVIRAVQNIIQNHGLEE